MTRVTNDPAVDLDATVLTLLDGLEAPDPAVRDEGSTWPLIDLVTSGTLDDQRLRTLGESLVKRLEHPRVEARSFAALVLAYVVRAGVEEPGWFSRFARWYVTEREVTGYDPQRGWVHVVAHGADALAAFGHTARRPRHVLDAAVERMLNPEPSVWREQEDDRLGYAIAVTLANSQLSAEDAVAWLDPVRHAFAAGEPGPVPPFATNTMRTLRMVHLLIATRLLYADTELSVSNAEAVREALADVLHVVTPWMWRATRN
ncbi:hypothetical protein BKD30_03090 [Tersicoccus phoenicis]|uniref:DUF2785 domain-containing protein n=1 Tax=Tersicoccus phoenicis TaxID=554083 RepID=A0A1R1LJQ7_9MICC|nr:hypothetical protein BKD30_03090 [Tersicoccus phoenicis]